MPTSWMVEVITTRSPPGSLLTLQEPKYSAIGAGRVGHMEGVESDGLWYDRCLEKHLVERMVRNELHVVRLCQQKVPFKEQEAFVRTAAGMALLIWMNCLLVIGNYL